MSVRADIARGLAWAAVERWARNALAFVVYFALARLLAPEFFGLIALAGVFVAFLQIFVTQGLGTALIQRADVRDEHLDTAFWISLGLGVALFGLVLVAAGPAARAVGEPSLAPVIAWLGLSLPINALSSVPTAVLMRSMRFKPLAIRSTLSVVVGGAVGVAMALAGFGVWSLVGQQLVGTAVGVAALWTATDWRPGLRVSRACFRDLFGFSAGVLGNNVLWYFSQRLDQIVIGVGLGSIALGVYFLAYRFVTLVLDMLTAPLQSVALPWFSQKQDDHAGLRAAYTRGTRLACVTMFPIFLGLWAVGDMITPLVFGSQWIESGPVVAILALAAALRAAQTFVNPAMLAIGRPGLYLALLVGHVTWTTVAMAIGFQWGVVGVAWAVTAASGVTGVVNALVLRRLISFRLRDQARMFVGPGGVAVMMALGVRALMLALPDGAPILVTALAPIAAGAALYSMLAWFACRDVIRDGVAVARGVLGRGAGAEAPAPAETPISSTPETVASSARPSLDSSIAGAS